MPSYNSTNRNGGNGGSGGGGGVKKSDGKITDKVSHILCRGAVTDDDDDDCLPVII